MVWDDYCGQPLDECDSMIASGVTLELSPQKEMAVSSQIMLTRGIDSEAVTRPCPGGRCSNTPS